MLIETLLNCLMSSHHLLDTFAFNKMNDQCFKMLLPNTEHFLKTSLEDKHSS